MSKVNSKVEILGTPAQAETVLSSLIHPAYRDGLAPFLYHGTREIPVALKLGRAEDGACVEFRIVHRELVPTAIRCSLAALVCRVMDAQEITDEAVFQMDRHAPDQWMRVSRVLPSMERWQEIYRPLSRLAQGCKEYLADHPERLPDGWERLSARQKKFERDFAVGQLLSEKEGVSALSEPYKKVVDKVEEAYQEMLKTMGHTYGNRITLPELANGPFQVLTLKGLDGRELLEVANALTASSYCDELPTLAFWGARVTLTLPRAPEMAHSAYSDLTFSYDQSGQNKLCWPTKDDLLLLCVDCTDRNWAAKAKELVRSSGLPTQVVAAVMGWERLALNGPIGRGGRQLELSRFRASVSQELTNAIWAEHHALGGLVLFLDEAWLERHPGLKLDLEPPASLLIRELTAARGRLQRQVRVLCPPEVSKCQVLRPKESLENMDALMAKAENVIRDSMAKWRYAHGNTINAALRALANGESFESQAEIYGDASADRLISEVDGIFYQRYHEAVLHPGVQVLPDSESLKRVYQYFLGRELWKTCFRFFSADPDIKKLADIPMSGPEKAKRAEDILLKALKTRQNELKGHVKSAITQAVGKAVKWAEDESGQKN